MSRIRNNSPILSTELNGRPLIYLDSGHLDVSRFPARVKCAMLAWVALEEAVLAANR